MATSVAFAASSTTKVVTTRSADVLSRENATLLRSYRRYYSSNTKGKKMIKLSRSIGIHALVVTLMLGCFAISGAMADLSDGLVSWWGFEGGSTADAMGNNDGEAVGSPTVGAGYGGSDGLWFNGVDQYVTVPSSASLEISGDLSVVGWMNVTVGNDHSAICWKGQGIGWGPRFSWRIATTTDTNITWGRTDGNDLFEGAELWFATDNVIPGLDQWVHVALTSSSTDGQRAYVNGVDITDLTGQTDNAAATGPFGTFPSYPVEIGAGRRVGGTDGNDAFFNGGLDEIGIWDRTLSAAEVAELAAGGSPTAVEAQGKIATTWAGIKSVR